MFPGSTSANCCRMWRGRRTGWRLCDPCITAGTPPFTGPGGTPTRPAWAQNHEPAVEVRDSGGAWKDYVLDDEPPPLRARYGDAMLERSCFCARRLVEAGVSLVTVVFASWETHSDHLAHTRDKLLPPLN